MVGWNAANTAHGDPRAVTIIEGSTFCVSASSGDMYADSSHGWFYRDTRAISRWNLLVGGSYMEPLDAYTPTADQATFIGRASHPAGRESTLIIERNRTVGTVLQESVTLRNYGIEDEPCTLLLQVDSDFADLFDVKAGREGVVGNLGREHTESGIVLHCTDSHFTRRVEVTCPDAVVRRNGLAVSLRLPAKASQAVTFTARPFGNPSAPKVAGLGKQRLRQERQEWYARLPKIVLEQEEIQQVVRQSARDLAALRIDDPAHPGQMVVAAGAPWFMALFGRDSLFTSYMAMPIDRDLALGTLKVLAALQGAELVPETDEEPGRILHEVRGGRAAQQALGGATVYYGTADATPLFVTVLAELLRWGGLGADELERLLPHADRALQWVTEWGDRDGDGFVEYQRRSRHGLINQGWKDSWDGINFADGTIAKPPMALAEVQGYAYRAWCDRASIARHLGDDRTAAECDDRAETLKRAFNQRYWLADKGWYAVALDGDKRPVDALTSNIGHCLWSGIIDHDKAPDVARHLMSPQMFSGWGVRTLAEDMGAFNPVSYHNGSVWPHDNAVIADGLMRYGFADEARQVASGMLAAAVRFAGRLPELFCGFGRDLHPEPIAYPTSCSPQAWSAATPLHLLRVLLRFNPDVPDRTFQLEPALPEELGSLRVENLRLGGGSLTFSAREQDVLVDASPSALKRQRRGAR